MVQSTVQSLYNKTYTCMHNILMHTKVFSLMILLLMHLSVLFILLCVDVFIMCGKVTVKVTTWFKMHIFFHCTLIISYEHHSTSWTSFLDNTCHIIFSIFTLKYRLHQVLQEEANPLVSHWNQLHSDCLNLYNVLKLFIVSDQKSKSKLSQCCLITGNVPCSLKMNV